MIKIGKIVEDKEIDKIKYQFDVLYAGWECDSEAWVVRFTDGSIGLILTDHGRLYISNISELENRIEEYQKVILDTKKAISMLN